MSTKFNDQKKVIGKISAAQTLLEKYPITVINDPLLKFIANGSSIDFMLAVLNVAGVSQDDILNWISKLLSGTVIGSIRQKKVYYSDEDLYTAEDGQVYVTSTMEWDDEEGLYSPTDTSVAPEYDGVGYIDVTSTEALMEKSKEKMLKAEKNANGILDKIELGIKASLLTNLRGIFTCSVDPMIPSDFFNTGIKVDMDSIDMYGVLNNCPVNEKGKSFYFDVDSYNINNVYKSMDFNAYLWYVMNMTDDNTLNSTKKYWWDNRVPNKEEYTEDGWATWQNKNSGDRDLFLCQYTQSGGTNQIVIFPNPERYQNKRRLLGNVINKTLFEFNYDYIYSMKLFDTRTILANVLNALYGITSTVGLNVSVERQIIAAKAGEIVKRIIEGEDGEVSDCYYTFSNDEYDAMLRKSTLLREGLTTTTDYDTTEVDTDSLLESLDKVSDSATLQEQITTIKNLFTDVAATVATNEENGDETYSFSLNIDIINKLLTECVTQIVMQVLSPKVAMLFAVNAKVMGSEMTFTWEDYLSQIPNLMYSVVRDAVGLIKKELYEFMMGELKPLIEEYVASIVLERLENYKETLRVLRSLIKTYGSYITSLISSIISMFKNSGQSIIDNVNYADIIPSAVETKESGCK